MNFDTVWQIIRYGLIAVGGIAVGRGWVNENDVVTIVGAIGALLSVAWGLYVKAGTRSVPGVTAARKDVPVVSTVTGQTISGPDSSK